MILTNSDGKCDEIGRVRRLIGLEKVVVIQ